MIDCWSVHISKEFLDWMSKNHPSILIAFIPAGCTGINEASNDCLGLAQPCDLTINKKIKDIVRNGAEKYMIDSLSDQFKDRRQNPSKIINVNITLKTLKPMLVNWVKNAVDYFKSKDGEQLILDGWTKGRFFQILKPDFQKAAYESGVGTEFIVPLEADGPNFANDLEEKSNLIVEDWDEEVEEISGTVV